MMSTVIVYLIRYSHSPSMWSSSDKLGNGHLPLVFSFPSQPPSIGDCPWRYPPGTRNTWSHTESEVHKIHLRSSRHAIGHKSNHITVIYSMSRRCIAGYPLVMTNIAIENGHRNSEFSDKELADVPYVNVPEATSHKIPWKNIIFPEVVLCFSHGFPMLFPWFFYAFPMVFLCFSQAFPMVFLGFSYGFLMFFL